MDKNRTEQPGAISVPSLFCLEEKGFEPDFRLKMDLEAQARGLDKAPPPEPSSRSMPSPDNVWQRLGSWDGWNLGWILRIILVGGNETCQQSP